MASVIQTVIDFKNVLKYVSMNIEFVDNTSLLIFQNKDGSYFSSNPLFDDSDSEEEELYFINFDDLIKFVSTIDKEVAGIYLNGDSGITTISKR